MLYSSPVTKFGADGLELDAQNAITSCLFAGWDCKLASSGGLGALPLSVLTFAEQQHQG